MPEQLVQWAALRGYRAGWAPASAVAAVRDDLERRRRTGEIDAGFAREHLTFDYEKARLAVGEWCILVVIVPRPAHVVTLVAGGRRIQALLPPTYQRYRAVFEEVREELEAGPLSGAQVVKADVPLKVLAARMGLVRYGRNNITYAPGIGSYLQLAAYFTDAPLAINERCELSDPLLLDECADCGVCEATCPTGAIDGDRVLLRVERCLTLANENPGAWPSWIPDSAHRCLIGCLQCQRACPANPDLPAIDSGVVFDEHETNSLLSPGERVGPAWDGIRAKLQQLGRSYDEDVVGRNLRALLAGRRRS